VFSKHSNKSSSQDDKERKVTAAAAVNYLQSPVGNHNNKHTTGKKVIRVLLDTGSDGDLLLYHKGTSKHFPYSTRQMPNS
jgi:hypothetical protein